MANVATCNGLGAVFRSGSSRNKREALGTSPRARLIVLPPRGFSCHGHGSSAVFTARFGSPRFIRRFVAMSAAEEQQAAFPVYPDPFEEPRTWAAHLTLYTEPVEEEVLVKVAQAHTADPNCLQAKVGTNRLSLPNPTPPLIRDAGFQHCVYAVYNSPAALQAAKEGISAAVQTSGVAAQQCWLSYGKGGGGNEGDMFWIVAFEASDRLGMPVPLRSYSRLVIPSLTSLHPSLALTSFPACLFLCHRHNSAPLL